MGHLRGMYVVGIYMAIICEVDILVTCVCHIYAKCWTYRSIQHNGGVAHICNMAAIFVQ